MKIKGKKFYLIGIKGVGMAGIAILLKKKGGVVRGGDVETEFITDELLRLNNIKVDKFSDDKTKDAIDSDYVVYSAAHGGIENPLVKRALERGVKVLNQAEVINGIAMSFKNQVAICGSHGKTTTTSLLSCSLRHLRGKIGYLIGSPFINCENERKMGADYYGDEYFIFEADEYKIPLLNGSKKSKLRFYTPSFVLATNIEFDHPDVFRNVKEIKDEFRRLFEQVIREGGKIFYCGDDHQLSKLRKEINEGENFISFGLSDKNNFYAQRIRKEAKGSSFDLINRGKRVGRFKINIEGVHNVSNAVGVISVLLSLGFDYEEIKEAIKIFYGVKRRFEISYSSRRLVLIDDYAHHPTEILSTLRAARRRYPLRKMIVFFQPHTYSRTKALANDFVKALSYADLSFILPIFPSAREKKEDFKISNHTLEIMADKNGLSNVKAVSSVKEAALFMKETINNRGNNFVVLTVGAGDVYKNSYNILNFFNLDDK